AAARALSAILAGHGELKGPDGTHEKKTLDTQLGATVDLPTWEPIAGRLERGFALGDPSAASKRLSAFVPTFRSEPLLVCP
ncbi:hypothetical protein ABI025_15265, partial [Enterococcus faecium]|uniref:hypothetical protein n=1 Tax=Enterococcus faecium TaxID=1352 RepID=UPI003F43AAB8